MKEAAIHFPCSCREGPGTQESVYDILHCHTNRTRVINGIAGVAKVVLKVQKTNWPTLQTTVLIRILVMIFHGYVRHCERLENW